jgi:hypothetical protein
MAGLWCWVSLELCQIIMGKCVDSTLFKRKCIELSVFVHALKTKTVTASVFKACGCSKFLDVVFSVCNHFSH